MNEKKELTKQELVTLLNERGVTVWDAMLVICNHTGDILGHKTYGESSSAHAEMGPDGGVMFVIDPPEEKVDPKDLN